MIKNIIIATLVFVFMTAVHFPGESQINRRQVLKNNRRITKYRGYRKKFRREKKYNSIAVTLNSLNYLGDLAPRNSFGSTDLALTRPALGIDFGRRIGPRFTLRGSFLYGTIRGDDFESADLSDEDARFRYVRNLSFRNRIKELAVTAVVDLYKNEASYISRVQFTPYIFAGLAVFHHNPQGYVAEDSDLPEAGSWVDLEPLGTEGQYSPNLPTTSANSGISPYNLVQIAIPFGIGVRYRLNQVIDLSLEFSSRYTFTDYLDDVSQNYVDRDMLNSELAREMADRSREEFAAISGDPRDFEGIATFIQDKNEDGLLDGFGSESPFNLRGGRNDNDMYFVTSLKLSYIIGSSFTRAKYR